MLGAYLYQLLAQQMFRRDDVELLDKVTLVRLLLADIPSEKALELQKQPFFTAMYGHEGYVLRIGTLTGESILQTAQASHSLPSLQSVPVSRAASLADIRDWNPASDNGRVLSANGGLGDTAGQTVRIDVSRERSRRSLVLQHYVNNMVLAICLSATAVAFLSFVVRNGLRPLRIIIREANAISTNRLNTRMSVIHANSPYI